jgi:phage terminase large subunit-like protein
MAELEPRPKPKWSSARLIRDAQVYLAREDFVNFIRAVAPWFVIEYAHVAIARHLEALLKGEIDRLQIAMAPRTGKSVMASELFPAYWLGHHPADRIMAGGHSEPLQKGFGGNVQSMVRSEAFQSIFPDIQLVQGKRGSGRWDIRGPNTFRDGGFWAFGAGSHIAGRGFNLGSLDDPTSEQDKDSDHLMDKIERWYGGGFYPRRQPERNAILITATRWRHDDLPGRLLEKAESDARADHWTVLNIPALLTRGASIVVKKFGETDPMVAREEAPGPYNEENEVVGSFLPKRMPLKELLRSKYNMPERDWSAQYMGEPSSEEGAILKKKWWRPWPKGKKLPEIEFTVTFIDTAFEEDEENDASAATTWHIFKTVDQGRDHREYNHYHALLAGAWEEQVDAVDLMKRLKEDVIDVFHPNWIIIEKRASGIQLVQEMKRGKLPVRPWLPPGVTGARGKRPRAYASQVVFEQGGVHYIKYDPVTGEELKWPKKVIEQCSRFPFAREKDLVDTVTMCCIWLRRHFWLGLPMDEDTEEEEFERKRKEMNIKGRRLYGGVESSVRIRPQKVRKLYG